MTLHILASILKMLKSAETYNLQNSADPWQPHVIYQVVIVFYVLIIILVSLICALCCSYSADTLFYRLSLIFLSLWNTYHFLRFRDNKIAHERLNESFKFIQPGNDKPRVQLQISWHQSQYSFYGTESGILQWS